MEEEKLIAEQRLTESEAKTRQANQLLSETQAELDDIKAVQDRKVPNNKIYFFNNWVYLVDLRYCKSSPHNANHLLNCQMKQTV